MEVTNQQVVQMHRDNSRRMDSIEHEQRGTREQLSSIRELLAKIDERTKNYDRTSADLEQVRDDVTKAKGMGILITIGLGAVEAIRALLHR